MLKIIFNTTLSFLFVYGSFHVEAHHEHLFDQHQFSIIEQQDDEQHSIENHCQKCLYKNNKSVVKNTFESTSASIPERFICFNKNQINYYLINFSLFSRPPPIHTT